jgi:hypothetical protein
MRRTSFYINGCVTLQTVALRQPIFKQKKVSVTISLGIHYCTMGSSQPPSRDTVPLLRMYGFNILPAQGCNSQLASCVLSPWQGGTGPARMAASVEQDRSRRFVPCPQDRVQSDQLPQGVQKEQAPKQIKLHLN